MSRKSQVERAGEASAGAGVLVGERADAAPGTMLDLADVTKSFGSRPVLVDATLRVRPGEIVVIMGKSGSGKSTLLRATAGLTTPERGTIAIEGVPVVRDGKRLREWSDKRHAVGMIFQTYTLWPHMNVRNNLALAPRKVLHEKRSDLARRAQAALDEVGMGEHLDTEPHRLSGGERQRVAIARALMMRPKLLLCDEITSALDPPVAHEVLGVLNKLKQDEGIGCLIVTHDMAFAMKAADRLIFVQDGKLTAWDSVSEAVDDAAAHPGFRAFLNAVRW